jgi:nucleoid DNA-binding protein
MKIETATKKELSISISEVTAIEPSAVTDIINQLMIEIQHNIKEGKAVTLRGLGTFYPKVQLGKPCRDIYNGKDLFSSDKNIVKFRPSKLFIEKLNQ